MLVRELSDGSALLILQEDHADLAAQFAAHWGNEEFSRLDPYQSMLFATIYHDSGHREMEADLPIDGERGLPYAFRGAPAAIRRRDADVTNAHWIRSRDPYASLVVSMHHAGLRKSRYNTVRLRQVDRESQGPGADGAPPGGDVEAAFSDLEDWQRAVADQLGLADPLARDGLWQNYCFFQVFDLLSLHFCCDGYEGNQMKEVSLERAPVAYGSERVVDLGLLPTGLDSVRMTPYPFDMAPLQVSVMARQMAPVGAGSNREAKEAYYQARRHPLVWQVTS